jgi:hypothetical protein
MAEAVKEARVDLRKGTGEVVLKSTIGARALRNRRA